MFAGPVRGLQEVYREDLAHLDGRARAAFAGRPFTALPSPAQDALLRDPSDGPTQELVGAALANSLEAMYGAPEYGGNRQLVGWTPLLWPGDVQPRGYSPAQVSAPEPTSARPASGAPRRRRELPRCRDGWRQRRAARHPRGHGGSAAAGCLMAEPTLTRSGARQ